MLSETDAKLLLIVDDEPAIVNMLDEYFRMEGYATACATDAEGALAEVRRVLERGRGVDLALLDVNMPGMDGFELCRRLRAALSCPIIFLTARIEDADQLDGFSAGADDYVLKPFSLAVLGGRVRAHLAREARRDGGTASRSVSVFSDITIDYAKRTVEVRTQPAAGEEPGATAGGRASVRVDLTRTEFDIIALLSKHPGRVYDRAFIYEQVWARDATGDPSIVREHVRRIRNKFEAAGARHEVIETVWGVGYRWAAR